MQLQWHKEEEPLYFVPVRQVYGFFFDKSGHLLLQEDQGHYNLPGGKPEKNESFIQTLQREALEESQVTFKNPFYIGYLLITDDPDSDVQQYLQLRYIAIIKDYLARTADPVTERMYNRVLCSPDMANLLLGWGRHGDQQIEAACQTVKEQFGICAAKETRIRIID